MAGKKVVKKKREKFGSEIVGKVTSRDKRRDESGIV